jgi:hypothetical protein
MEVLFVAAVSAVIMILIGVEEWNALGSGRGKAPPMLGPLAAALCLYIILEYKEGALFDLPILVAVDLTDLVFPTVAVLLFRKAWT